MTALSEFVAFCFTVFVELVNLTLDLVALPFLVAALLAPWRSPFLLYGLLGCTKTTGSGDSLQKRFFASRNGYRLVSIEQFFIAVVEGTTLMLAPVVALSGIRTAKFFEKVHMHLHEYDPEANANGNLLCAVWQQFFKLLRDLLPFLFLLVALLMPWRWPYLCLGLRRHGAGWLFQTIVPCVTPKSKRQGEGDVLGNWIIQAFCAVADLATFFPLVGLLVSGLRTRRLITKLRSDKMRAKYDTEYEWNPKARAYVWGEFFLLLVCGAADLATAGPLLVVLVSGLRTRKLIKKLRSDEVRAGYDKDIDWNSKARALIWKQFLSLLVDFLFVPLALFVLLTGWRAIQLRRLLAGDEKGMKKRCKAIKLFFSTLIDVPFILCGLVCALVAPWRVRTLWAELKLWDRQGPGGAKRRKVAASQLCEALTDWVHIPPAAAVLCTPWRAHALWRELKIGQTASKEAHLPDSDDRRERIRDDFTEVLKDQPCVAMGTIVLILCPWRARLLWAEAKPWPGAVKPQDASESAPAKLVVLLTAEDRREAAKHHFFGFLVDLPVIAMATVVFATGWRAPLLWRALRLCSAWPPDLWVGRGACQEARWEATCEQFGCLLRDIPFLLLLPTTFHRLPNVCFKIAATQQKLLESPPLLNVSTATAARDDKGRLQLRIVATKPAELTASQVWLTYGGRDFWEAVGESYGTSVVSIGKSMLPAKMMPKYLKAPALESPGQTSVCLTFTIGGVVKALEKLYGAGDASFVLQGQVVDGKVRRVLFGLVVRPSDLLAITTRTLGGTCIDLEDGSPQPLAGRSIGGALAGEGSQATELSSQSDAALPQHVDDLDGEADDPSIFGPAVAHPLALDLAQPTMEEVTPIQDAVWSAVAYELVQLLLDVIRIIAMVCLVVAPWRFVALIQLTFEPVKRWPARQIDMLEAFLEDECAHAEASIDAWHARLCVAARGDEHAYPVPPMRVTDHKWRGPPLPTCMLYVGLAKPEARVRIVKKLTKLDEPLATLYGALFENQQQRRLCVVQEAEVLRGALFPLHGAELHHMMSHGIRYLFARDVANNVTLTPTDGQRHVAESAELLRTADCLRSAVEREQAGLYRQIIDARKERKKLTGQCKLSFGALCKRSSSKARQQLALLCKGALFDWLSILGIGLLLCTVYRVPSLLGSLRGVRCWRSVHTRVALQLKQIPYDLLMLLQLLLLTLAFWQAIETWLELSDLLLERRDVPAARRALSKRLGNVADDIGEWFWVLFTPLILWDTYKFVLATLCFGSLVPVHLVGKLLALAPRICCRSLSSEREASSRHFWLAGLLWTAFVAFPFYLVYVLAPSAMVPIDANAPANPPAPPWAPPTPPDAPPPPTIPPLLPPSSMRPGNASLAPPTPPSMPPSPMSPTPVAHVLTERGALLLPAAMGAYLGAVLIIGVLSSSVAISTNDLLRVVAPRRVLRWTAANAFAIFQALLDIAQLAALPFLALQAAGAIDPFLLPNDGVFHALQRAAEVVTLWVQLPEMTTPLVFCAFGALVLWYLLFSLPIVIDELLKWQTAHGKIQNSKLWSLLMHPLNSTLHVTVLLQLIKPLGCTYTPHAISTLYADPSIRCWDPHDSLQSTMALCALLGIAFYLLTVHVVSSEPSLLRQAQQSSTLDVQYSELYVLVSNALRAAMAICYLLLHDHPMILLPVLLATSLLLVLWTLGFQRIFHAPACAISGVIELRAVGDAIAAWAAVCCLMHILVTNESAELTPLVTIGSQSVYLPELMCLAGWLALILLGLLAHMCRRLLAARARRDEIREVRACAKLAMDVEEYWQQQGGVMGVQWAKRAVKWRRASRRLRDVPALSRCIVELEQHVRAGAQLADFVRGRRPRWQRELMSASPTAAQLTALVGELRDSVMVIGRNVDDVPDTSAADDAMQAMLETWRGAGWTGHSQFDPLFSDTNVLKLTYSQLVKRLLHLEQQSLPALSTDVGITAVGIVVAAPAAAVASDAAEEPWPSLASSMREDGVHIATSVSITTEEAMDHTLLRSLKAEMLAATTNFERVDLVQSFEQKHRNTKFYRVSDIPDSGIKLTCAQLATLAETMTLSTRKKEVLVHLHGWITDKHNFHALVEEQLTLLLDREEVLRDVGRAERKNFLSEVW